jgi:hypothetical protein
VDKLDPGEEISIGLAFLWITTMDQISEYISFHFSLHMRTFLSSLGSYNCSSGTSQETDERNDVRAKMKGNHVLCKQTSSIASGIISTYIYFIIGNGYAGTS